MESKKISSLIKKPEDISGNDITNIESIILQNPYFQVGQILLAKGLLNTDSIRYNQQLKRAAAYCLERRKLFELITLHKSPIKNNVVNKDLSESIVEKLEIGKPLDFNEHESHSFSEWLSLLNTKKIERKKPELIADFLQKEVKRSKPNKQNFFKATDIAKESLIDNENLVTPTLAKVYLEQGHYEKAISAYNKLILKYPKKNSFFASQIDLIKELNKK